jgi:hypothetical protein
VFSYLIPRCGSGSLRDPGQIGIEVAVPGVPGLNPKRQVCKDVVIWPSPGDTCWDATGKATRPPSAILEWKCHRGAVRDGYSTHDREWLEAFTSRWPGTEGFLVRLDLRRRTPGLDVGLMAKGKLNEGWLRLGAA